MTTLQLERTRSGQHFWLVWVLANIAGWAISAPVQTALYYGLGVGIGSVLGSAAWGLIAGFAQWLVLRERLDHAGWWVPASAAGWALAQAIGDPLIGILGENVTGLIHTFGTGLLVGLLQWLILRRQVKRAGWWVLASTLLVFGGLLAGAAAGFGLGLVKGGLANATLFGFAGGAAFGMTTGAVLGRLLRATRQTV
jgi:hypothetical protein